MNCQNVCKQRQQEHTNRCLKQMSCTKACHLEQSITKEMHAYGCNKGRHCSMPHLGAMRLWRRFIPLHITGLHTLAQPNKLLSKSQKKEERQGGMSQLEAVRVSCGSTADPACHKVAAKHHSKNDCNKGRHCSMPHLGAMRLWRRFRPLHITGLHTHTAK